MLEGAKRRASMCQAFYQTFYIRERYIVPVGAIFQCPKGTTQISHGTRTKCRKTRAMQINYTKVVGLALKQLRHFYGARHSFAKIFIRYTIY